MSRDIHEEIAGLKTAMIICCVILTGIMFLLSINLHVIYAELCWSNPALAHCATQTPATVQQAARTGAIVAASGVLGGVGGMALALGLGKLIRRYVK